MNLLQIKGAKRFSKSFLILIVLSFAWENSTFIAPVAQFLERLTLDFRYKNFAPFNSPSDKIVFIDIDDYSLDIINKSEGRWPWKRDVWYDTIQLLSFAQPKVVLFDILFTENDTKNPDSDKQLATVVHEFPNISLAMSFESIDVKKPDRFPASSSSFNIEIENATSRPNTFGTISRPYSPLWENLNHVHIVNSIKDTDGLFRFTPIFLSYDTQIYPSLTLKALQIYLDNPKLKLDKNELWLVSKEKGQSVQRKISLDENRQFYFHFYKNDFQKVPFESLYALSGKWKTGTLDPDNLAKYLKSMFHDKIVIVGGSATGLQDLKATPVNKDYPGSLLHAIAISNILDGHQLKRPFLGWHFLFSILLVGLIYLNFVFAKNLFWKYSVPVTILGLYFALGIYVFQIEEIDFPLSSPLLFGLLSYGDGLVYLSFTESRQKRKIAGTLSKYLSPQVTQQLLDNGIDPSAEVGHRQELTILFSDVRDFTSLSEKVKPEQVVAMLNSYLGHMTQIVFDHKGTLDKFIGDAVMAFWGAPVRDDDAPFHAVQTAIAMLKQLRLFNAELEQKYGIQFAIGIGVNTGEVIVGNIGSDRRLDYTVIGDNVNLASRLEGLTKAYGVELIVGDNTYEKIKSKIFCRPLDLVQVKGKNDSTPLYEAISEIGNVTELDRTKVSRYNEAFNLYVKGDFSSAELKFNQIIELYNDGPSKLMLYRCVEFINNPPKNWSGIFKFTSK